MSGVRPGGEIALHVEFSSKFLGGSGMFYHIRSIEYQYKIIDARKLQTVSNRHANKVT